jgi:hypothetical protein
MPVSYIKATAMMAVAEASRSVFGMSGASMSQYGILSFGRRGRLMMKQLGN